MASTNQSPEYKKAELEFSLASTDEEKIACLEEMMRTCPKHKSSEKMLANIKTRYVKLKDKIKRIRQQKKKSGRSLGIKRSGDGQITIIGFTNSGKSSLLSALTNARPKISEFEYATLQPEIGTFEYEGCKFQMIELPSLRNNLEEDSENLSVARTSDLIIVLVISNNDIDRIFEELQRVKITTPRFVIAAKSDIYAKATRADLFISVKSGQDIERLKKEIFERLNVIRIYTKEPGKKPSDRPLVLKKPANIRKLAKHIREDFIDRFDFALIWGPSAKFSGQKVGLEHDLKDKDIVELHLKK